MIGQDWMLRSEIASGYFQFLYCLQARISLQWQTHHLPHLPDSHRGSQRLSYPFICCALFLPLLDMKERYNEISYATRTVWTAAISSRSRTSAGLCNEQCICLQFLDALWWVHICIYNLGCPTPRVNSRPPVLCNVYIFQSLRQRFLMCFFRIDLIHHIIQSKDKDCAGVAWSSKWCWATEQSDGLWMFHCFGKLVQLERHQSISTLASGRTEGSDNRAFRINFIVWSYRSVTNSEWK